MTKQFGDLFRRGLALLLCFCLVAGYIPVPGFAEEMDPHHPVHTADCGYREAIPASPCTHIHGTECYTMVTQCVHSHDASCYSDASVMEQGGTADACAHVCTEGSGCVTQVLNCTHVHDDACGYREAVPASPCTFVCTEDHSGSAQETTPEEPTEATEFTEPTDPTEETAEATEPVRLITAWTWVDPQEAIDPDTGMLLLSGDPENPVLIEQLRSILPAAILAQVDGIQETVFVASWHCDSYPAEGAYQGSFPFVAELPEGYILDAAAPIPALTVRFDQPIALVEYEARVGEEYYESLSAALDAAAAAGATVTLLKNALPTNEVYRQPDGTTLTIDLNGFILTGAIVPGKGADLKLDGSVAGSKLDGTIGRNTNVKLTISGGTYGTVQARDVVELNISSVEIDYLNVDQFSSSGTYVRWNVTGGTYHEIWGEPRVVYALAQGYCLKDVTKNEYVDLSGLTYHVGDQTDSKSIYTVVPCAEHTWLSDPTQEVCAYCDAQNPSIPSAGMVAMVGDTYYETLQEAVEAAQPDGTVKVIRDCLVKSGKQVNLSSGTVTVDLNGKTVSVETAFMVSGGTLLLTSSNGIGKIDGDHCSAVDLEGGSLTVNGSVVLRGYGPIPAVEVTSGVLTLNQGVTLVGGIRTSGGHSIMEYLAVGTAYAQCDYVAGQPATPGELVNGGVSSYAGNLVVVSHSHSVDSNGVCPCGFVCTHSAVDPDTGKCTVCKTQLYSLKLTANDSVTYYNEVNDALAAAADAAKSDEKATLLLLTDCIADTTYETASGKSVRFVLDLNGHELGGTLSVTAFTSVHIKNGTIRTVKNEYGQGRALLVGAAANVDLTSVSIFGYEGAVEADSCYLTINSGSFDGGAGNHALTLKDDGIGAIKLNGGTFHGIQTTMPSLLSHLVGAVAYAGEDGSLFDAGVKETLQTLTVVPHLQHTFDETGKCACGVAYEARLIANGAEKNYTSLQEAIRAAANYSNATVQLLRDVDIGSASFIGIGGAVTPNMTVTVDWNGHTLTGSFNTGTLVIAGTSVVTLTGAGGVSNTYAGGASTLAIDVGNIANVTILSGTYDPSVRKRDDAVLKVYGGVFQDSSRRGALASVNYSGGTSSLHDLLPDGKTLAYDTAGTELVDVYAVSPFVYGESRAATEAGRTVYVVDHAQHQIGSDGKCACGYAPIACVTAGESAVYFDSIQEAVDDAAGKTGSTLTLLKDVTLAEDERIYLESGNFTIDWHGHTVHANTWKNVLTVSKSTSLILSDTVGGGGITNTSQLSGAAVMFNSNPGYTLTITGGIYSPLVQKQGYGTMRISGGEFQNPQDSGRNYALQNDTGNLSDMLAPGYGFFYEDDNSLIRSYSIANTETNRTVIVAEHEHSLLDNSYCRCECGLICDQENLDENGYCATCGHTFVARTKTWERWPFMALSLFEQGRFNDAITHALSIQPKNSSDASIVQVLSDAVYDGTGVWNQNLDMELNGHHLTLNADVNVTAHVLTLYGGKGSSVDGDAVLTIGLGGMLNIGTDFGGTLQSKIVIEDGVLGVKAGSTVHFNDLEVQENAGVTLSGGTYHSIEQESEPSVRLGDLLGSGYVFQPIDDQKDPYRYKNSDSLGSGIYDVKVVACDHKNADGTLSYIDGVCDYCGQTCDHTDETGASTLDDDGVCSVCGTRTALAKVIVNGESTLCKNIVEIHLAMGSAEDGSSITVKLLKDVDEPRNRYSFSRSTTVDLNGHNLNLGGFSISESDVTVTLVDTAENSTAKAEKLWLGGVSVTGSGYKVESGHWNIETFTGFHLWVTGGTIEELLIHKDEDAEGVRARISGGTVNNLAIEAADGITLEGGYFENVRLLDGGTETPFSKLLQADHAVATNEKGNVRVRYDNLPTITSQNKNVQYYVVECAVGQRNHYYKALDKNGRPNLSTDTCLYCKHVCQHPALDENGKCTECQLQMAVEVTTGDRSVYRFQTLKEAIEFVNSSADESLTLKLLSGCQLDSSVSFSKSLTLDLNGRNLTCADGVSLSAQSTVTLTLKDSAEGSTATAQGGIDCVAGSTVIVESGSWGSVAANGTLQVTGGVVARVTANAGTVTLSGGEVTQLTEAGGRIEVSGGTVGTLSGSNDANILLSGGTFKLIQPEEGAELDLRKILAPDHCYQNGSFRHPYEMLGYRTTGYKFVNMEVAECTPHEYSDGYISSTGFCLYCNHQCSHPAINETGVCTTCSLQMQASVTCDDMVTYYPTIQEAVKAATGSTAENVTVQLLSDAALTEAVSIARDMTLDLNGKQFSVQDDSIQLTVSAGAFTLTDSGTGSGSCGAKLILTGGTVAMAGGKIAQITANSGTMTLSGGEVTQLTEAGGRIEVSGGTAGALSGSNDANILLSGGTFKLIQPEEGAELDLRKILAPDHCYQNGSFRHPYEMLGYRTTGYKFVNMEVAECTPHEYSDGYISSTGFCLYCNHQCLHEAGATNDLKCTECGLPFAASLAYGDETEYFIEVYSAFNKASRIVLVNEATLTLLRDAELTKTVNHTSNVVLTVNENGKTLTAADGVSINLALEGVKLILTGTNDERTTVPFNISKGTTLEVQNGTWSAITVEGEGTLQMSGGTVASIDATAASAMALISGGNTTGTLAVGDSSRVTLTGGTFGRIEDPSKVNRDDPASGLDFDFTKLLGTDREADLYYAFGSTRTGGMKLYEKLISDNQGCFDNMKVVLCEHIRGSADTTAYVNGICLYCDRHCLHETIGADGTCTTCGHTMPVAVTQGSTTRYFETFEAAMNAVNAAEAQDGFTIKLLKDVKVYDRAIGLTKSSTLDLNGKNIDVDVWGNLYLQCVNLTLKDSAPGSAAKAGFSIQEADSNVYTASSPIRVESGNWENVYSSRIVMTGGHVGSLSLSDQHTDCQASISGGSVDTLWIYHANVSLSGGYIGSVVTYFNPTGEVLISTLLAEGHAFASDPEGTARLKYLEMPALEFDYSFTPKEIKAYVVPCEDHVWSDGTGYCIYCRRVCPHDSVTNGECDNCYFKFPVCLISTGETALAYYMTLAEALDAAQLGENTGCIVKLLTDGAVINGKYVLSTGCFTLNLNGKTIQAGEKWKNTIGKDVTATIMITKDASVTFNGAGTVNPYVDLDDLNSGNSTNFLGGTYSWVTHDPDDPVNAITLAKAAHFVFKRSIDGLWSQPHGWSDSALWLRGTATAMQAPVYLTIEPESATVAANATKLPANLAKLTAFIADGWTVTANWSIWISGRGWVTITGDINLTSGQPFGTDSFINPGLVMDTTYDVQCVVTATREGERDFKFWTDADLLTLRVTKNDPSVTITPSDNLTYSGHPQALVASGSTDSGTLLYSLSKDGNYSTDIPTATDAGTYEVWYKVQGNDTFNTIEPTKLEVVIAQAVNTWTQDPAITGWTYGDPAGMPSAEARFGTVAVDYRTADGSTYDSAAPTVPGDYMARFTVAGNANYSALSEEIPFTVAKRSLTVTIAPGGGTYGGTIIPATAQLAGLLTGDTVKMELTYDGSTTVPTSAGTYTIQVTVISNDYVLTGETTADFVIAKAVVETPALGSKVYNGAVQIGDVPASALYAVTKNDGGVNVGTYDVELALTDPANYQWDVKGGKASFQITKAPNEWTLEPSISGWTYGEAASQPTGEAKFGKVSVTYSAAGKNFTSDVPSAAGAYTVRFTVEDTENYAGLTADKTLVIARREITVTITPNGGTYGGIITPAAAQLTGVLAADTVQTELTYNGSPNVPINAGTYTIEVTITSNDYILTGSTTANFVIAKATVETPTLGSKIYNGQKQVADVPASILYVVSKNDGGTAVGTYDVELTLTDPVNYQWDANGGKTGFQITNAANEWTVAPSIIGWIYGDTASTPTGEAKYGTVKVDYRAAGGSSYRTAVPTAAGDYVARFTVEGTDDYGSLTEEKSFTISKRGITVAITPNGGTYAGIIIPATAQLTGVLTGDTVKMELTYDGSTIVPTSAGTYTIQVTVTSNDYVLTGETTADFVIAKAVVETPALSGKVYSGAVQIADVPASALYAVTKNDGGVNVGTYDVELALTDPANYQWDVKGGKASFQITKASNEWTLEPFADGWTYGEPANKPVAEARFGTVSVEYSVDGAAFTADMPYAAGDYMVRFQVEDTENYAGLIALRPVTIGKATVVTPALENKIYNGANQIADVPASALYTVIKNDGGTQAGAYEVQLALTDPANYQWDAKGGVTSFSITDAVNAWTVAPSITGWTYGDAANIPTGEAKFGTVLVEYRAANSRTYSSTVPTRAGDYAARFTVAGTGDYSALQEEQPFSIAKREITVTITPNGGIYGGAIIPADAQFTGVLPGDTVASRLTYNGSTNVPTKAGTYTVAVTVNDTNYILVGESTADFVIEKQVVETPVLASKVYTGSRQTAAIPASNLYVVSRNPGGTDVGTYEVALTLRDSANYRWDVKGGVTSFQITKAANEWTVTPAITGWTYGSAASRPNGAPRFGTAIVTYSADGSVFTSDVPTAAGSYTVRFTVEDTANYTGLTAERTFTVAAKKLTVAITANGGVYNGTITPASAKLNGVVSGDTVDVMLTYDGDASVPTKAGIYTIQVTINSTNYKLTGETTAQFVIEKATVVTPALENKVYNGTNQTADVPASALYTVTVNNGGKNVGTYEVQLALTEPANYQWDARGGVASFSITDAVNEWTVVPSITGWTYGDAANIPTGEAKFGTVLVEYRAANSRIYSSTVPNQAGDYVARFTVEKTKDYSGLAEEQSFTIARREVTIIGTAVEPAKVYDGTTQADIIDNGILSANFDGSNLTLQPGTAAYEDKNVGTGKTVAFTGFALAGSAADNYLLTAQPAPVTADITAKDVTLTVTVKEKSFDGTTDAEVESAVLTGVVNGDEVTLTSGKASFAHSAIGQWDISFEDFALTGADAGNYHLTNPAPTGVTAAIRRNSNYLDVDGNPDFDGNGEINIEGEKKNVIDDGGRYLLLSDSDKYITVVTYLRGADAHSSYPTGMKVYRIHRTEDEATLEYIPELDNLLQYAGCSIRVTGNQGIRMITALSQSNKAALTGSGLAGFTLEEYGTAVCWADSMTGSLTLGKSFARSNYAYKKGVADPVFHRKGGMMQYTNVLVGFSLEECSRDMVMRPYITLLDADGELVTLYGGNVQRSIGYIAYQNRNCKQLGNAAYEYVWEIIHAVYGDAYDDEYTG